MTTVAYFAHTGGLSGPNHSLMRLLQVLDRSRFKPLVYFPDDGYAVSAFMEAGEQCRVEPMVALERTLGLIPQYARDLVRVTGRLRCALMDDGVELAHINTSMTPYAGIAARSLRIPLIWHVRECVRPDLVNDVYMRGMVALAHRLVAVSGAVRTHLEWRVPGAAAKVDVIHNGIDLERFNQAMSVGKTRPELGLPEDRTLILMPAFLLPHKGHEILLEATHLLVHEMDLQKVCVLIAGEEGPQEQGRFTRRLMEMCASHRLNDHVMFLGLRTDLPAVLAVTDVVCLPSTFEDPFPNGVLEAMAAGKPVVATRTGGIPEMVDDERTGLLVARGQSRDLAQALARVVTDESQARRMGEEGRRRLSERFSARVYGERVQALYERVLNTRAGHC